MKLTVYPEQLIHFLAEISAPDKAMEYVKKYAGKGGLVLTIKPEARTLSDQQREYYYAVVVPSFVAWVRDTQGTVYAPDKMDAILRQKLGFFSMEWCILPDGQRLALLERKSMSHAKGASNTDMTRFLDDCNSLHVEWFGVELPQSNITKEI